MTVNIISVPAPAIGDDAHSISSLTNMLNVMNQNFSAIQTAIATQDSTLAAQKTEYLTNVVPTDAVAGDKWFKTDNADPALTTSINVYVCVDTYTVGEGLSVPQKEAKYRLSRDIDTITDLNNLQGTVDGKTTTFQSIDPPASARVGDGWIDINPGEENGLYTVISTYDYSANTPYTSPTGVADWTPAEISSHFRLSGDKDALALATTADTTANAKRTNHLQEFMPGLNGEATTDAYAVGDSWTEDVSPDYQSYVCYVAYVVSDIPGDTGLHPQFLLDHWREKGDKTSRTAAQAAQATADGKIENFRQQTVPQDADLLDTWYKDSPSLTDQAELYVNTQAYTTAFIDAGYIGAGYGTPDLYRESFWDQVLDQDAVARANAANSLANTKTTDFYLNDPPDGPTVIGDKWIDKDATPVLTYICKDAYDFSSSSPVWQATGTDVSSTTPSIPMFWDLTDDTASSDTASLAKSYVDTKRTTFTGLTPPEDSNVAGLDIDIGDTWVKVTNDPSAPAVDPVTGIAYYTVWVCYRSYSTVSGIGFTGTGYSSATGNDGVGTALNPGDGGFTDQNAYNYWKQTNDQAALEFALDIAALQDGKRNSYISNSLDVGAPAYVHNDGIPDAAIAQGGIGLGDIWVDEGSVNGVNGATDVFQVYKCKRRYAYDDPDIGFKFQSIGDNWLAVDEPILRSHALFRRAVIDGKRSTFVSPAVPNAGGPANWDVIGGAQLGDVWIDSSSSPNAKYWCKVAYVTGGTLGTNWESLELIPLPTSANRAVNVQYITNQKGANDGLCPLDSGGKVLSSYLPAIAVTNVYTAVDDTARDLQAAEEGDMIIVDASAENNGDKSTYIHDSGIWPSWILIEDGLTARVSATETVANNAVAKSGGSNTMTQDLIIDKTTPTARLDDDGGTDTGAIKFFSSGSPQAEIRRSPNDDFLQILANHTNTGLSMNTKKIIDLEDPTDDDNATNKGYVDGRSPSHPVINSAAGNANTLSSSEVEIAAVTLTIPAGMRWRFVEVFFSTELPSNNKFEPTEIKFSGTIQTSETNFANESSAGNESGGLNQLCYKAYINNLSGTGNLDVEFWAKASSSLGDTTSKRKIIAIGHYEKQ